ncbi:MAG TPA: adenylyltransferase/cytidyltransferase family protein [Candidatus Saccharimonadales bacterium]
MKHVGIYSGTFNPVHKGHVAFAAEAMRVCGLDEVTFAPEHSPRGKQNVANLPYRIELLRRETSKTANMRVIELKSPRFTVKNTLPEIKAMFAGAKLTLLIGSDVVKTLLNRWGNLDTLLADTTLAIGMRGNDRQEDVDRTMACLRKKYGLPVKYTIVRAPFSDISSTLIREQSTATSANE